MEVGEWVPFEVALFRSKNNVASHKVSGLVSKQENPSEEGESQTEIRNNLIYSLPWKTKVYPGLCYANIPTLLSSRRQSVPTLEKHVFWKNPRF